MFLDKQSVAGKKEKQKPDIESAILLAQTFHMSINDLLLFPKLYLPKKILLTYKQIIIVACSILLLGCFAGYLFYENSKVNVTKFLLSEAKIDFINNSQYKITVTLLNYNKNISMKLFIKPDYKNESDTVIMQPEANELKFTAIYYFNMDYIYDIYLIQSDGKQIIKIPLWNYNKSIFDQEYRYLTEFNILDEFK
ncbi:MAG: hypothetical protein KHZ15_10365 [Coprobacillus cateniformis]|uniref:hypothetical protein n=1 Tax=Longibaculum muris TaxID=1796628 RepID=UPI003AB79CEC|nr:hypothetical protein [Coprobacillus cateniformis]